MGYNPQESLENTINTMDTLLGYTQLSLEGNPYRIIQYRFFAFEDLELVWMGHQQKNLENTLIEQYMAQSPCIGLYGPFTNNLLFLGRLNTTYFDQFPVNLVGPASGSRFPWAK